MARYLALGKEPSFGQEATSLKYVDIASEDLRTDQEWIIPELAGSRWKKHAVMGPARVRGSVSTYAQFSSVGDFLLAALGHVSTSQPDPDAAPTVFRHEFRPADSLPSYTLMVASEVTGRKFLGCLCSRLELTLSAGELLGLTFELVGRKEEAFTPSEPEFDGTPYISSSDLVLCEIGGSSASLEALALTISNDLADDAFELGSRYLPEIPVKGLEVSGSFDLKFKDRAHLDRFLAGGETSLRLRFEGPEIAGGLGYAFELEMPRIIYRAAGANISARDRLVEKVEFEALYDEGAGYVIKAVLQNEEVGY
ncbi:hypothetical protein DRO32_00765 [Candidatus Bathyarchaeota archaeon]|nr:MAG: hypothetical protein DRO32_00765 [Candidatus Bathyarchaeota archaeon]